MNSAPKASILILLIISFGNLCGICQSKKAYSKQYADRLRALRTLVEQKPDDINRHNDFISTWGIDDSTIVLQYKYWLKKYPNNVVVPYAIGSYLVNAQRANAEYFLNRVLQIDSNNADAWFALYNNAVTLGKDSAHQVSLLQHAINLNPGNKTYYLAYINRLQNIDTVRWKDSCMAYLQRYPKDENTFSIINNLINSSNIVGMRYHYYDYLLEHYHMLKGTEAIRLLNDYYAEILFSDSHKALSIAKLYKDTSRINYAQQIINADSLVKANQPDSAWRSISPLKHNFCNTEHLLLEKARIASHAGFAKVAFDTLVNLYAQSPSDTLKATICRYGETLGLTKQAIFAEIKGIREKSVIPATDFSLMNYFTSTGTRLSDFKGKAVLLSYWFPACNPCRKEFPHFERVLKRLQGNNIVYLAPDLQATEPEVLLALVKANGYSFIPLKDSWARKKGNLQALGAPTNYLIDPDGRIAFSNFRIDETNERTLELMMMETLKPDSF